MKNRLFIGGLAYEANEEDLREAFARAGGVRDVSIKTDRKTGRPRGIAFVEMENEEAARAAINALNGSSIHGRKIRVMLADPKPAGKDRRTTDELRRRSTDEIVEALQPPRRWVPWAVFGAIAIIGGGGFLWWTLRSPDPTPNAGVLLVTPFAVHGQAEGDGYLGLALAEAIAVNLATVEGLRVLPVPSVRSASKWDGDDRNREALGAGAGRLLVGTVTRTGDHVYASVTLLDPGADEIIWGTQKEGKDNEILSLASGLAQSIAGEMGMALPNSYRYVTNVSGGPLMAASADTSTAIAALRQGQFKTALDATLRLTDSFGDDAAAWVLRTHALMLAWDARPTESNRRDLDATIDKLEVVDPKSPYSTVYRAYLSYRDGEPEAAIKQFTDVLTRQDLAPTTRGWVLRYRAVAEQELGNDLDALSDLNESLSLDPTNAWTLSILSGALQKAGKHEEALTRARQGLSLSPGFWRSYQTVGEVLVALERYEDAAKEYGKACDMGRSQTACGLFAVTLVKAGRLDEAKRAAADTRKLTDSTWGNYNLGCYYALTGDRDRAMKYLEASAKLGLVGPTIVDDTDLASLREDPAFKRLAARVVGKN